MPVEWVVGGLVSIISALAGAVVFLFRRLLAQLDDTEKERDDWKAIAMSGSRNLGDLVPAVAKLSAAVEAEHRVAQEFREAVREDARKQRGRP